MSERSYHGATSRSVLRLNYAYITEFIFSFGTYFLALVRNCIPDERA